jgi:hypothetical protein
MALDGIDAYTENLGVLGVKQVRRFAEPGHFGGTDKREVGGIKEKDEPFSAKGLKREVRSFTFINSFQPKIRCLISNANHFEFRVFLAY